jgi:hypothetical protein
LVRALPGDGTEAVDKPAGAGRGIFGREGDDGVGALGDRLRAAVVLKSVLVKQGYTVPDRPGEVGAMAVRLASPDG